VVLRLTWIPQLQGVGVGGHSHEAPLAALHCWSLRKHGCRCPNQPHLGMLQYPLQVLVLLLPCVPAGCAPSPPALPASSRSQQAHPQRHGRAVAGGSAGWTAVAAAATGPGLLACCLVAAAVQAVQRYCWQRRGLAAGCVHCGLGPRCCGPAPLHQRWWPPLAA
jgi:hypothetical protein